MRYGSICSGIEAASVAWEPLGFSPAFFSEIDDFPSAVLAHRWPAVPNLGDFTQITRGQISDDIDILVGGTPCQSFSVAGLRGGLSDDRGNLALEFLRLAQRLRPRWLVWENVPGVLSSWTDEAEASDGDGIWQTADFDTFLYGVRECGYGCAWRVLDAQHFGVPQRRRRVFVIGHLGDWRPAAAVLFERESLQRDSAPQREAREDVTAGTLRSSDGGVNADHAAANHVIAHALTAHYLKASSGDPTTDNYIVAFSAKDSGADASHDLAPTLRSGEHRGSNANGGVMPAVAMRTAVRRLTPVECSRLQGFPDTHCHIPWTARRVSAEEVAYLTRHGIRCFQAKQLAFAFMSPKWFTRCAPDCLIYKALGNSMAVPVMRWIGSRIALVDGILQNSNSVQTHEVMNV